MKKAMDHPKTLSICVVALNEENYLPNLLADIKRQQYPHELTEIVLVDSGSTDRTRQLMEEFSLNNKSFYSVQVLDNPKRIQAAGWNVAIRHASGDVISRIDAHTMLPAEFSRLVMRDITRGEDVVGGIRPCLIENNTAWGKTLLAAENALFGSSIGGSRRGSKSKYVKTMFHASYRREVFERAGLFNEYLLRTEDNELHYRIRMAGYKLYLDPEIVSYQFARNSFPKMIRQKYANGRWIGLTLGVCPGCISLYHLVPAAFVLGIVLTGIMAVLGFWQLAALMWAAYLFFGLVSMIASFMGKERSPLNFLMPLLFLVLHVSYGVGTLVGLFGIPALRKAMQEGGGD